jgi:hypothetical protein
MAFVVKDSLLMLGDRDDAPVKKKVRAITALSSCLRNSGDAS